VGSAVGGAVAVGGSVLVGKAAVSVVGSLAGAVSLAGCGLSLAAIGAVAVSAGPAVGRAPHAALINMAAAAIKWISLRRIFALLTLRSGDVRGQL
jgi:hypothetical protein